MTGKRVGALLQDPLVPQYQTPTTVATSIEALRASIPSEVQQIVDIVWNNKDKFMFWPATATLKYSAKDRTVNYHSYTVEEKKEAKLLNIRPDTRSNGPAVTAYLVSGGKRPERTDGKRGWTIHHVYDGKFPLSEGGKVSHAVKNVGPFSHSGGLVAIHPVADANNYPGRADIGVLSCH